MNEEDKRKIIQDLNARIGGDINDLSSAYVIENELVLKREQLQSCLHVANNEVPTKLSSAIKKAEKNSKQIENLKVKSEKLKGRVEAFLKKTEPLRSELNERFIAIHKLEEVLVYLKSFEKIEELSQQIKQCNDDEQAVLLYGELKELCTQFQKGHRGAYLKEYTHYWHNVLKDKFTKQYEDIFKQLKWPFTSSSTEHSPLPKEVLNRFSNLTRYLFLIEQPEVTDDSVTCDYNPEGVPCLPVRILLRPLKKRFMFHFTGPRQTARIDRPEWFLTQTLTWIKDHQAFVGKNVQPVADGLELHVNAVDEFNAGLISLAAERLHTVLGYYNSQGSKEIVDADAAFAHAVDETLGFHRELVTVTGGEEGGVLAVLTRAETFVRWLAVERKYALSKMDEMLENEQWMEPVASIESVKWVPRGADWFIALLKTIEDRYVMLPQPGHRLQFLELQLELIEEWRVRLTQLLSAALRTLQTETFLSAAASPHPLTSIINAAHHTRSVLLQWAHSLHYLQLHYYRRQFEEFTHQQHHDETSSSSTSDDEHSKDEDKVVKTENEGDQAISLREVEVRAKSLAQDDVTRKNSRNDATQLDVKASIANLTVTNTAANDSDCTEEATVFAGAPALLAHLRDAGLQALVQHILDEFKAQTRDYAKLKWHSMGVVEELALSVSRSLCAGLATLLARLCVCALLAPALQARLRAALAAHLDQHILQEVVLENWFNTGGTMQFTHDVKRNLIPAFAPPNKVASQVNQLPKLSEACKLLNLDYDDAQRLRGLLAKQPALGAENLTSHGIIVIKPADALRILNQRTDLSEGASPASVMELF